MAVQNLGRVGIVPKGAWSGTTDYVALDLVSYDGNSWVAKRSNKNVEPTTAHSDDWQLISNNADLVATVQGYKNDAAASAEAAASSASSAAASATKGQEAQDMIAPTEASDTASMAHPAGSYFILNGVLYQATSNIASGAAIVTSGTGANCKTVPGGIGNTLSGLKNTVAALAAGMSTECDLSDKPIIHYNISPSTGKWTNAPSSDFFYFEVPSGAAVLTLRANSTTLAVYALLTEEDAHISGTIPKYATGCSRTVVYAGTEISVAIPNDCKYIWLGKQLNDVTYAPEYLGFNVNIDQIAQDVAQLKAWENEASSTIAALETSVSELTPTPIADKSVLIPHGRISSESGEATTGSSITTSYTPYIDIGEATAIVYARIITTASSMTAYGMAFYDSSYTYIAGSGIPALYGDSGNYYYEAAVPQGAKYARFSAWAAESMANDVSFAVYDANEFNNSLTVQVAQNTEDIAENKAQIDSIFPSKIDVGQFLSGIIRVETGDRGGSSSGICTAFVALDGISRIKYTRIATTGSSAAWGMTFYDSERVHIDNTGEGPILSAATYGYVLSDITVPTGAAYARFTWNSGLGSANFALYDADQYESTIAGKLETIEAQTPNYSGKRVSILGDSISTFAYPSEKVDGKAAEGCTTNYPGNYVQYSNSNVTEVGLTWWGRVLNHYGMVIGINESWAGSCIAYNPNQTSSGKYTADNCLCSEARIGHLGENGTPDIIIVFGGTNDINHHRVSATSTLRYAVGELDNTHNPLDYDNFPMVTETYYGSITTMLLRIQHSYPNATILMLLPYFCTTSHTSSGDRATPYDQQEWANAAIDVCNFLGVEYLDLRKIINLYDVTTLLFDDLHPRANGMEAIAKAVIHKLDSML